MGGVAHALGALFNGLARGAYDVKAYQRLGPDFRQKLDAEHRLLDLGVRSKEEALRGDQIKNESAVQEAIKDYIANLANVEPEEAITGMGQVGGPATPEVEDRTQYPAPPPGTGLTPDQAAAMAGGARKQRKDMIAAQTGAIRADASERSYQQKLGLIAAKHDYTMDELRQKGLTSQEIERARQEGRIRIVGMQEAGKDSRLGVMEAGKNTRLDTSESGKDARSGAYLTARELGSTIGDLRKDLRIEEDDDVRNSIRARIAMLEAEQERRGRRTPRITTPGTPGVPVPPAPPKPTAPPGAPKQITSRAEAEALPDGALFILGGRVYRKQGRGAVPVQ